MFFNFVFVVLIFNFFLNPFVKVIIIFNFTRMCQLSSPSDSSKSKVDPSTRVQIKLREMARGTWI